MTSCTLYYLYWKTSDYNESVDTGPLLVSQFIKEYNHGRTQRGTGVPDPLPLDNYKWLYVSLDILVRAPIEMQLDLLELHCQDWGMNLLFEAISRASQLN